MNDPVPPREALYIEHHLAQAGRLSAFLVHELNNQLAAIYGYVELLQQAPEAAPFAKQLDRMQRAAERAQELLQNYRATMRIGADPEPVNIGLALETAIAARRFEFDKRNLALHVEIAPDVPTYMLNPGHVQLALGALLDNAYEEMAPRSMGDCRVSARRNPAGGVTVEVTNMAEAGQPDATPWRSTKPPHRHAGLGLAVARWVAEATGGACEITREQSGDVRVEWTLSPPDSADAA